MSADPNVIPLNQARRRIHAAAMKLFAERGVTKVNISELAVAAGMARGTIYSHVSDVDGLFEEVAAQLAREMTERVVAGFAGIDDPAQRLAIGVRQYIRRAHEEPLWGRFMSRFGLSPALTQALLASDPVTDLRSGIESGRYRIGRGTWREIGSDTAELLLAALGVDRLEARTVARSELPPLPAGAAP
jgi:AcrR family transcriptional regulator